jgi:hypothetical protein
VSGAAELALGAVRLKYDRRGEDTIESTCWTLHLGKQLSSGPVEDSAFPAPSPGGREKSKNGPN